MKHFGTDGIRALDANFTDHYLETIAAGLAALCDNIDRSPRILLARDTRSGGMRIASVLSRCLRGFGCAVADAGLLPTPALAYLTAAESFDWGVMISASHNPPEYNGIKVFNARGEKASDDEEEAIEERMLQPYCSPRPPDKRLTLSSPPAESYIRYLLDCTGANLRGMHIALDTANGATALVAAEVFRHTGAEVSAFFTETDGARINVGCGATHPEVLQQIMTNGAFDMGFSFDGDGDRVMAVTGGKIYNGDRLMLCHGKAAKARSELLDNVIVGTVMSNLGTEEACARAGIRFLRAGVGDKEVWREMKSGGYTLGGEESGHIIFQKYMNTGDGILAALLTAMLHQKTPLSFFDDIVERPSVTDNVPCDCAAALFKSSGIEAFLKTLPKEIRAVVRPSGTEPKIRILVEAPTIETARQTADEIKIKLVSHPIFHNRS